MKLDSLVRRCAYDPSFYQSQKEVSFSSALGYFAAVLGMISVVSAVAFSVFIWWSLEHNDSLQNFRTQVEELYPDTLVLSVGKEGISTNVSEPFAIPFPESWQDNTGKKTGTFPKNLLVINTAKSIESADFSAYDTLAILSKNEIGIYKENEKKAEIQSIKGSDEPFDINKGGFVEFVGMAVHYFKWIVAILLCLSPFFIFLFLFLAYLVYLVFGALVVWLAAKLRGVSMTYSLAYRFGLYLIVLPLLYESVLAKFFPILSFPFDATFILFILALINFQTAETAENTQASTEVPA